MTDIEAVPSPKTGSARSIFSLPFLRWLQKNPVILKEMRSRMRGWRSFLTLGLFTTLLAGIVGMIYLGFSVSTTSFPSLNARKELGQSIFLTIFSIELMAAAILAPSFTASAIASEKERQTFDLLRTTLLSAPSLVVGKLLAALSFVLLLLFATLPLQSISIIFGGITFVEIALGTVILGLTALTFGAVGIFFSSFITKTRIATVLAQGTAMFITFGFPIFALFIFLMLEAQINPLLGSSTTSEIVLIAIGWLIAISTPVGTTILSEAILVNEGSLFLIKIPLSNGIDLPVLSPWIGFIILYPLLTFILLRISIGIVRRADR